MFNMNIHHWKRMTRERKKNKVCFKIKCKTEIVIT